MDAAPAPDAFPLQIFTLREAAARLRVSEWTARKMVADGRLRPLNLTPGKILVTARAIEEAVRAAERPPTETSRQVRGEG
jgi:excisionase family DNA binding protein